MGMLVLSRKIRETIYIGENITVTLLGYDAMGKIRIGIDAPRELEVDRADIRAKKDAERGNSPRPDPFRKWVSQGDGNR